MKFTRVNLSGPHIGQQVSGEEFRRIGEECVIQKPDMRDAIDTQIFLSLLEMVKAAAGIGDGAFRPVVVVEYLHFKVDNSIIIHFQGIPIGGYAKMVEKMLDGIDVRLNTDYFSDRKYYDGLADKVVFTGMIDEYFDYCFGELEYRSLRFETETLDVENYQGNAVVNYTEYEIPYTRIIEHKHFEE